MRIRSRLGNGFADRARGPIRFVRFKSWSAAQPAGSDGIVIGCPASNGVEYLVEFEPDDRSQLEQILAWHLTGRVDGESEVDDALAD